MVSYLLCYTEVCRHVHTVSVLGKRIYVARLEDEVCKCRIGRLGSREGVYVSIKVHVRHRIHCRI